MASAIDKAKRALDKTGYSTADQRRLNVAYGAWYEEARKTAGRGGNRKADSPKCRLAVTAAPLVPHLTPELHLRMT